MPRSTPTQTGSLRLAARRFDTLRGTDPGTLRISTRLATASLEALAPALPPRWYPQSELLRELGRPGDEAAARVFERAEIAGRYLASEGRPLGAEDNASQYRRLSRASRDLAIRAARQALTRAGGDARSIGCLVVAASSDFVSPALSSFVATALELPADLCKYDLVGAGCVGALPVLSLASQYLAARPDRRVLGVCIGLGSEYLRRGATDKEQLVVNSLFADAAIGLVAGAGPVRSAMPQILDVRFRQGQADLLDSAGVDIDERGAKIARLHRELPDRSVALFEPLIEEVLAASELERSAIAHWILHPGGRAILDRLQSALGLADEALVPSRAVLRQHGNAISPTCLLVLHHVIETGRAQAGDLGLLCSIGPSLTAGVALLKWPAA